MIAIFILAGFVGLIAGGELLVRGASNLAVAAKVPPLIIGLTVVAIGTSAPELAVSVQSCYRGETDLAVGNVVGSNLSNLLLILGAAAIVGPLSVSRQLFKLDIPVMIAAIAALFALGSDGSLSRGEGIAMAIATAVYLAWTVIEGKREGKRLEEELEDYTPDSDAAPEGWIAFFKNVFTSLGGLALLVYGAEWLVWGCVQLAEAAGVSSAVIGLTIIAIGTSLPELVISVIASARGKRDLAVGNVVGSNILNVLAVLGLSAVVAPEGVGVGKEFLEFHIPLTIAFSVACVPVFLTGMGVSRSEGIGMVFCYFAYIGWLVYLAMGDRGAPGYVSLVGFLAPLAVVMVGLAWGQRGKPR